MAEQTGLEISAKDQFVSSLHAMIRQGAATQAEQDGLTAGVGDETGAGDFSAISTATADFLGTIPGIHMSQRVRTTIANVSHTVFSDRSVTATMTASHKKGYGITDVSITFPIKDEPLGSNDEVNVTVGRTVGGQRFYVDLTFSENGQFRGGVFGLRKQEGIFQTRLGDALFDTSGSITEVHKGMSHVVKKNGQRLNIRGVLAKITSPVGLGEVPDVEGIIASATL